MTKTDTPPLQSHYNTMPPLQSHYNTMPENASTKIPQDHTLAAVAFLVFNCIGLAMWVLLALTVIGIILAIRLTPDKATVVATGLISYISKVGYA
jgi:hypothetical protein